MQPDDPLSELSDIEQFAAKRKQERLAAEAERIKSQPKRVESQEISNEQLRELREECVLSLFFLAKAVLGYKDLDISIHGPLCKQLMDSVRNPGENHKRIILPRSWFKSTVCSIAFPIWLVLQPEVFGKPGHDITICIAQNSERNALKKLDSLGQHFTNNNWFRLLFPELIPDKTCRWTSDSKSVPRKIISPEGTFEGVGVRSKTISRHYDVIIEDDTVAPDADELGEENIAPTKDDIDQAIGWHRLVMPFFNDPNKHLWLVVGTRWFELDLLEWIKQNQKSFTSYERGILEKNGVPDEDGEPTWPARFNREVIAQYKEAMGPYMFSCLYLNKPVSSVNRIFQSDWFVYYENDPSPADVVYYTSCDPGGDPAASKGKTDYTAVVTCAKSLKTGHIYVIEISRERKNVTGLLDTLFRHCRTYHPQKVGIETQGFQKTLLPMIQERRQDEKLWFHIEPITNNQRSKNQRIEGLQPFFSRKQISIKRGVHQVLYTELLAFPNAGNDDVSDALSMQLELWGITLGADPIKVAEHRSVLDASQAIAELLEQNARDKRVSQNPVFDVLDTSQHFNLMV